MNNFYSQSNQNPESNRMSGRERNERWGGDDNRGARGGSWREDNSQRTPNRSAWGEQRGYSQQSRYSPNFSGQSGEQDWQTGSNYDEYGYYGNDFSDQQRGAGGWQNNDDNYENSQEAGVWRTPHRMDNPRGRGNDWQQSWQGRSQAYGDSGQFGYRQQPWQGGQSGFGGQDYGARNYGTRAGQFGFGQQGVERQQGFGGQRNYGGSQQNYGSQNDYGSDYSFGDNSAAQGQQRGAFGLETGHRGKGPKGYVRTDERIREEICEWLSDDPRIDASDISVEVREGVVTLEGAVPDRTQKHRAEDIADCCSGVKDVRNSLRVTRQGLGEQMGMGLGDKSGDKTAAKTATKQ